MRIVVNVISLWLAFSFVVDASSSPLSAFRKRDIPTSASANIPIKENNALPSYVVGRGPSFHPADVTIGPPLEYTATGKYSVFAPPHGDFFPFGGRFWWPKLFR